MGETLRRKRKHVIIGAFDMEIERKITFNEISSKGKVVVVHPKTNESLAEITGYGLSVKFNMELIKTTEDIDAVTKGIGDSFKELLMQQLMNMG